MGTLKERENLIKTYAELHWNEPLGKYEVQYCYFSSPHYNKINYLLHRYKSLHNTQRNLDYKDVLGTT